MINEKEIRLLQDALKILQKGSDGLPAFVPDFDAQKLSKVMQSVALRMQDNYPYHHPQYVGQMLKPPHPIARIAYAMSLWVNPNNHALDGGRASSRMEKECIVELATMFGWKTSLGHLTGGGTMANLEALWVAGRLLPGKRIVGSTQAHYTHSRISDVLGLPYTPITVDAAGRLDIDALQIELDRGDVGTVVVTMGNTGFGSVDPLVDILALQPQYNFRIHADAAYGGYFGIASQLSPDVARHYAALEQVDSIVIDPHKHGLQPYGCGCVLFRDASVGAYYKHDSAFTYFSSDELHLGEISLECSRPGASAVALWATQQLLPPTRGGEFAGGLDAGIRAANAFYQHLLGSTHFTPLIAPDLDIVVYAVNASDTTTASVRAKRVFDLAAHKGLHLALFDVPTNLARNSMPTIELSSETVTCLRSVLMKPEHEDWLQRIVELLDECGQEVCHENAA